MKKIVLLIISVSILFANSTLIHSSHILGTNIYTICVDGYKFIVIRDSMGVSMVQQYESRSGNKPPRPVECN